MIIAKQRPNMVSFVMVAAVLTVTFIIPTYASFDMAVLPASTNEVSIDEPKVTF